MIVNQREFGRTLALIRFWRHQRRTSGSHLTGDALNAYRQKCTHKIQKYLNQANALKGVL